MKLAHLDETKRILSVSESGIEGILDSEVVVEISEDDASKFEASKVEKVHVAKDGTEVNYIHTVEPLFYIDGRVLTNGQRILLENPEFIKESYRPERNRLLSESDWTQSADSPLSSEQKASWQAYRQSLRDLDSLINENGVLTFPKKP